MTEKPAGWYPLKGDPTQEIYWDGAGWAGSRPRKMDQFERFEAEQRARRTREEELRRSVAKPQAAEPATATSAPAGWYVHPSMADTQRYWDGQAWTDHVAPGAPRSAAAPDRAAKPDPTYAWGLALLPLASVVVALIDPVLAASTVVIAVIVMASLALAALDAGRVRKAGYDNVAWAAAILVPLYLVQRTIRVKSTPAIPVVWVAAFAMSVLASFTFAATYDFNHEAVESEIESWFNTDMDMQGIRVDCPDEIDSASSGDTFPCGYSSLKKGGEFFDWRE